MNKLRLETLVVESFETSQGEFSRGTVRGYISAFQDGCLTETDELSCPGTCEPATCAEQTCGPGGGTETDALSCRATGPWGDTCCQQPC